MNPIAYIRNNRWTFSEGVRLIFAINFNTLFGLHFKYLTIDLLIALLGVLIGAPYNTTGLIREPKSVVSALNYSFERITFLSSPNNSMFQRS